MKKDFEKLNKLYADDPAMLKVLATQENNELLRELIAKEDKKTPIEIQAEMIKGETGEKGEKGDKGDKGDTGEQGIQGIPGLDGADGQDADETKILKKVLTKLPTLEEIIANVKIPPSTIDEKALLKKFLTAVPETTVPTTEDIVKEIKKKRLLELRDIRGARLDMNDQRWHGGGISNITGLIQAGTGISIAGVGTSTSPYIITATGTSPLTTKGDLFTFTTVNARLGVGTNGQILYADSTATTGLKWITPTATTVPGGNDTDVQFNDGGTFGGQDYFTFDKNTGQFRVGVAGGVGDGSNLLLVTTTNDINNYSGFAAQNLNAGDSASTDISLSADNDTSSEIGHYVDMGITSSGWNPATVGNIKTVSIKAGGTGYSINDVITISGGGDGNGEVTVTAIDGGGGVTGISLTFSGTGYTPGICSTTGGSGDGALTVNVLSIIDLTLWLANDAYLFGGGGNLIISTDTLSKVIKFSVGGIGTVNEVGRFTSTGLTVGLTGTTLGRILFSGSTSTGITVQGTALGLGTTNTLQAVNDTFIYRASTDTLTNKTYDTAGTGNSFLINGVAVTANTGTGAVARAVSPAFTTPNIGVATATTVNKITITQPATGATLTIQNGFTLTVNGNGTFSGTTSGTNTGDQTLAGLGGANTALSNLASVAINTSLIGASTSINLGAGATPFGNLYLKSGGIIDFNNGNVTVTHSAGNLAVNASSTLQFVSDTAALKLGSGSLVMFGEGNVGGGLVDAIVIATNKQYGRFRLNSNNDGSSGGPWVLQFTSRLGTGTFAAGQAGTGATNGNILFEGADAFAAITATFHANTSIFTGTAGVGLLVSTTPDAQLHVIQTTEQFRVGYDRSNYWKTTVNSTGNATLALVGTTPLFTFSQGIILPAGTATALTYPLKFTSGTLLTVPVAGVMEYLTDAYYVTTTTNAIRRMLVAGSPGRATAQTAANTSVATYTLGATDASYEVSANVLVTTSSAENFTVTVSYTDEGNTARTLTLNFQTIAGVVGTAINFANGAVPYEGIITHLRCKASTAITVKTTGTFTGCTYNCEGIIKQIA